MYIILSTSDMHTNYTIRGYRYMNSMSGLEREIIKSDKYCITIVNRTVYKGNYERRRSRADSRKAAVGDPRPADPGVAVAGQSAAHPTPTTLSHPVQGGLCGYHYILSHKHYQFGEKFSDDFLILL